MTVSNDLSVIVIGSKIIKRLLTISIRYSDISFSVKSGTCIMRERLEVKHTAPCRADQFK